VTAVFAGTIAVAQFDIKKVLAYSTVSQLGFMVAAVGMGAVVAGVFHLMTHAFFKALLFLGAGSVIHGVEHGHHHVAHAAKHDAAHDAHGDAHPAEEEFDPQDMRNMGGIWNRMRITSIVYLIGALALGGFPFVTAGFWSKDEILVEAAHKNPAAFGLLLAAAGLTAFYMTRQVIMIFFGKAKTEAAAHAAESPRIMTVPLMVLAFFSLVIGYLNAPLIGIRSLSTWIEGKPHGEFDPGVAASAIGLAALGFIVGYFIYRPHKQKAGVDDPLRKTGLIFKVLNHKYWIDELYGLLFVRPFIRLSHFLAWVIDWRFWHDWFHERAIRDTFLKITDFLANPIDKLVIDGAVNGTGRVVTWAAGGLRKLQTGYVRTYALALLVGVVLVVAWFALIALQGW
jgi:NADH-quinone oxidoreductase subunit L